MNEDKKSMDVYKWAIFIRNASGIFALSNVIWNFIMMFSPFDNKLIPEVFNSVLLILNIVDSVIFSGSMIIASLYGSSTLSIKGNLGTLSRGKGTEREQNLIYDVAIELHRRYKHSNLNRTGVAILRDIQDMRVSKDHPLFKTFVNFRKAVLCNLLYRVNLGIFVKMLLSFFVFYNYIVLLIYYSNVLPRTSLYSYALYLAMNVINPLMSLVFSYIVVLCDNVNSIVVYLDRVRELKDVEAGQIAYAVSVINKLSNKIEKPFFVDVEEAH